MLKEEVIWQFGNYDWILLPFALKLFTNCLLRIEYIENFTWRQAYLKLYFELYMKYFRYSADFKYLYKLIEQVKDQIAREATAQRGLRAGLSVISMFDKNHHRWQLLLEKHSK